MSVVKYTTQVRRSALRPFLLLALILPFAFFPSSEIQFGELEFAVPHGWQHQQLDETLYLFPEKSWETSTALIRLEHGGMFEGDLQNWLPHHVSRYEQNLILVKRSQSRALSSDSLRAAAHMLSTLKSETGQLIFRDYVAAEINGAVELIILQTSSAEAYQNYLQSFHSFLENMEAKPSLPVPPVQQVTVNTATG